MIEGQEQHRMALDASDKIKKLALFDIMPNRHIWTVQKKGGQFLNGIGF